jgi:hypothetical protein
MEMQKEKNLECSSADSMVMQKAVQTASLTERQSEDSLMVIQMVMKKVLMTGWWKETRSDVLLARLKVTHLAYLSDEMMALQKAMQTALQMAKSLVRLLAHSMVIQTVAPSVMLKERHLAHLLDEMMALQKALLSD